MSSFTDDMRQLRILRHGRACKAAHHSIFEVALCIAEGYITRPRATADGDQFSLTPQGVRRLALLEADPNLKRLPDVT